MATNSYGGWTITGKKQQHDIEGIYGPKTGKTAPSGEFPLDPTFGQIPGAVGGAQGAVGFAGIPSLDDALKDPATQVPAAGAGAAPGGFLGLGAMNSAPSLDQQTNPSPVPNMGSPVVQPSQNAMQRQQEEAQQGGTRTISPARRFFWSTGLIDGSAPLSPRSAPTDFDATFGAGAPHMGKPSTTWEERQAQNRQKIADAKDQRGLDSWKPY